MDQRLERFRATAGRDGFRQALLIFFQHIPLAAMGKKMRKLGQRLGILRRMGQRLLIRRGSQIEFADADAGAHQIAPDMR